MPKNVVLAASFATTPERLFDTYLDPRAHADVTGRPVTIEPRAGASFRAFDGMLSGTILHVEPKRLIVQTWRSANWPGDAIDSVLTLSFWPEADGARIELVHVNVPASDFAGGEPGLGKVLLDSLAGVSGPLNVASSRFLLRVSASPRLCGESSWRTRKNRPIRRDSDSILPVAWG